MRVLVVAGRMDRSEMALFKGLVDRGVEIEIMFDPSVPEYGLYKDDGSIPSEGITFSSRIDFRAIKQLKNKMSNGNYDVIHSLINRALSNSLLASRGSKVRHVAYRGTMGHLSRFDPASWMTYLHPRLDHIICVSEAVRQYMLSLGMKESKPVTIHKGHDLSWYESNKRVDMAQFGIPAGSFVVAYAGGFRPVKGVDTFLRSAHSLPEESPIHYLLIGEGKTEKALRQMAADEKIKKRIHFAGFRNDATAIVGSADAFVMPSLEREGLPRGVVEAMAQGVPSVVSNVGGMPELVKDGETGIVVEPGQPEALSAAFINLANDNDKCSRFAKASKERIKTNFNINTTVEKVHNLYNAI